MHASLTETRPFVPGTTGWSARDLDDPRVAQQWAKGNFEISEGVLTTMAPAYFSGGNGTVNLIFLIRLHLREKGLPGRFATEVDLVIDQSRVACADAAMLLPEDELRQAESVKVIGSDLRRTRLLVPPTLIIESVSPGHELHDRRTKRKWYAEFGVPHYWILDAFGKSLECLVLREGQYAEDVVGRNEETVCPSLFPGLKLALKEIWSA